METRSSKKRWRELKGLGAASDVPQREITDLTTPLDGVKGTFQVAEQTSDAVIDTIRCDIESLSSKIDTVRKEADTTERFSQFKAEFLSLMEDKLSERDKKIAELSGCLENLNGRMQTEILTLSNNMKLFVIKHVDAKILEFERGQGIQRDEAVSNKQPDLDVQLVDQDSKITKVELECRTMISSFKKDVDEHFEKVRDELYAHVDKLVQKNSIELDTKYSLYSDLSRKSYVEFTEKATEQMNVRTTIVKAEIRNELDAKINVLGKDLKKMTNDRLQNLELGISDYIDEKMSKQTPDKDGETAPSIKDMSAHISRIELSTHSRIDTILDTTRSNFEKIREEFNSRIAKEGAEFIAKIAAVSDASNANFAILAKTDKDIMRHMNDVFTKINSNLESVNKQLDESNRRGATVAGKGQNYYLA